VRDAPSIWIDRRVLSASKGARDVSRAPNLRRAFGLMTDVGRALGVDAGGAFFATIRDAGEELDALERELEGLRAAIADRPTTPSLEELAPDSPRAVRLLEDRVLELEKERAGLLRSLEGVRADHAALRAELEASVERHGRTSRELADARAALADLDGELAASEGCVTVLEAFLEAIEGKIDVARVLHFANKERDVTRLRALVHGARRDLNMRRRAPGQGGASEQAPRARRSRTNARSTEPKGSGSHAKALSGSSARKDAEHTRLPKLPPPAPAPDKIGSIPPEGDDKSRAAPDAEGSSEVQNG
jgi:chromosome segregation ATPase